MGSSTRTSGRRRASAPRRFVAATVTAAAVTAATAALAATALLAGGAAAPAVAQSPSCPWMNTSLAAEQRAQMLVAAMNIDQKIAMLSQAQPIWTHYGVAGYVPGQPSLCIPDLVLNDAGQGVGDHEVNTVAFPAPISQASSWDGSLQRRFGAALGWEAWHKGINVQLAPGIEIDRLPINGRNFEYMSEDPYLAGQGAVAEVQGIQSNPVIATVKHYVANSQETNRMSDSADVDMRTLEEIYTPAYEAAVRQGRTGSVMCSYNRINSVYACENPTTLNKILKQQFGFDGFVMSDWNATHSTVPAANAGLDMEMGLSPGQYFNSSAMKPAVESGQVSMSRLNDMVLRITRAMFRVGIFDNPTPAQPGAFGADVRRPEDVALARTISEDGTVLLKNDKSILPLTAQNQKIAVIGPGAGQQGAEQLYNGGGSGHIPEVGGKADVVSPLQGVTQRAQAQGDSVLYADGSSQADAIAAASAADVAIVFVGAEDSEGNDRPTMSLASGNCTLAGCSPSPVDQDALISAVAAANPHTIVVLNTGGPVTMPWLARIQGLLEAWYPGQEDGNAIAALLFGDVDPSAHLTETFPASQGDLPTRTAQQYPGVTQPGDSVGPHSSYSEGLLVGYRWYDAKNINPLFPFGFGLSYTTFDLRNLSITPSAAGQTGAGVSFDVVNTGGRAGAEVPQLYVGDPPASGEPPRQLKGFTKVALNPGETRRVTLPLDFRSFAHWDAAGAGWQVTPGCYGVAVGRSSRDLPLTATIAVGGASCSGAAASIPIVTVLPSRTATATCLSRRSILIHLFGVRARQVRRVTVFINGRRTRTLRGRRSAVRVTLRRLPRGLMHVRLVVSLGRGRSAVLTRTYRTCTPKHSHRLARTKKKKKG